MSRDWLVYLDDLIESAEKIGRFLRGRSRDDFAADEMLFDAGIVWVAASVHAPKLLLYARELRERFDGDGSPA